MFKIIFYKEAIDHLTRFRFVFAFLLCSVLVITSIALRALDHKEKLANFSTSTQVFDNLARNHQDSLYLGIEGAKIVRRPQILSSLIEGVTDIVPDVLTVSIIASRLRDETTGESPLKRAFESLDYNFIIRLLMSLLALLFSYDAIAGERERGTLRAVLANSLPRSQLLLAKMSAGFTCLMIPLVFSTLAGLLLVHIFSGQSLSGDDWQRFGLIFLASSLYTGLFFFVGLLLSIVCRGSKTALLSSFFVWIILILIVPNLSVLLAGYIRPVPSKVEMLERKRLIEAEEEDRFVMRMIKTGNEEGGEAVARDQSDRGFEMATNVSARLQSVEDDYLKQLQRQSSLAEGLSLISPASAYSYLVMDLAGTGLRSETNLRRQLQNYSPAFIRYIKSKIEGEPEIPDPTNSISVSDMPRFQYQAESLSESMNGSVGYLSQLLLLGSALVGGCFLAFSRSDVRDEF